MSKGNQINTHLLFKSAVVQCPGVNEVDNLLHHNLGYQLAHGYNGLRLRCRVLHFVALKISTNITLTSRSEDEYIHSQRSSITKTSSAI